MRKTQTPLKQLLYGCARQIQQSKAPAPVDYSKPRTYTPKFLADEILTARQSIEGERKLVTVLFADIANYTAMSEKLDPEEVHQIMDGCPPHPHGRSLRYEGTINQFTGDGVMGALWGPWPVRTTPSGPAMLPWKCREPSRSTARR